MAFLYDDVMQVNQSRQESLDDLSFTTASSLDGMSETTVYWLNDKCRSFEFVICTIVIGALCVIGMAWNTMAIMVLHRDRQNKVASFLLQVLAWADNAVLLLSLIVLSAVLGPAQNPNIYQHLRFPNFKLTYVALSMWHFTDFSKFSPARRIFFSYWVYPFRSYGLPGYLERLQLAHIQYIIPYLKKYINPLGYVTHAVAIWTVVLLAVNRFVAVCLPFKAERYLTFRNTQIQVLVVVICSVVVNIPRLFQYDVIWVTNARNESYPRKSLTEFGKSAVVEIGYFNAFYSIVVLICPMICLIVFNIKLICELQKSKRNMQRNSLYYMGSQEKNITFVMILVILQVLVCHTPDRVITVFRQIAMMTGKVDMSCPDAVVYGQHFANVLIILNCFTNFFIYYFFRARFRRIFLRRFCTCCYKGLGRLDSVTSREDSDSFVRNGRLSRLNSARDHLLAPVDDHKIDGDTVFGNGVVKKCGTSCENVAPIMSSEHVFENGTKNHDTSR